MRVEGSGVDPRGCTGDRSQPLDDMLHSLPYLGKAAVHTLLEGLAADEFILLRDIDTLVKNAKH